jgi:hypothetical protein
MATAPSRRVATTTSLSAPTGGWNARDSIANMPPLDAVTLSNFYATPTDVQLRLGYTPHSQGITSGRTNTLMNYAGSTEQQLFAAAGTKLWNVTTEFAFEVQGLSNDKLQYVNISNAGGHFLVAVNGQDGPLIYNGTNWINVADTATAVSISTITHVGAIATVTTGTAHNLKTGNQITVAGAIPADYNGTYEITVLSPTTFTYEMATTPSINASTVGAYTINFAITGVDPKTFINVNLFQNRLYFTQKDTMKCWYLPVNALAGEAKPLDFGGVARMGGFLQAMGTWTIDAGQGVNDYAVFVTNMGEVIVYGGDNPDNADTWALRGVWQLGYVFNRKCFFKFGGDLLLLTQDGLVPLASALQSSRLDPRVNITDKIYYAISQAASLYSKNYGWQIIYYASQNMLLINIPVNGGIEQFVMNTISKAWSSFNAINTTCWEMHEDNIFFGGADGTVYQFWDGYDDNGSNINAEVQQAYTYFDDPGQNKRFTMVRPTFQTRDGFPTILAGVNTDFSVQNNLGAISYNPNINTLGKWNSAIWDQDLWGGYLQVSKFWQGVTGIGYSAGIVMKIASQDIDVHWVSTDYVYEKGGVL